jgi:hypothetical protein
VCKIRVKFVIKVQRTMVFIPKSSTYMADVLILVTIAIFAAVGHTIDGNELLRGKGIFLCCFCCCFCCLFFVVVLFLGGVVVFIFGALLLLEHSDYFLHLYIRCLIIYVVYVYNACSELLYSVVTKYTHI